MNNSEPANHPTNHYELDGARPDQILTLIKVLIGLLFIYPVAHYSIFVKNVEITPTIDEIILPVTKINLTKPPPKIVVQPTCPISHLLVILKGLCDEVNFNGTTCTPEDFNNLKKHKIPVNKNSGGDPRSDLVGYLVAIFIVISLFATFWELYKEKRETPAKVKAQMQRKCSLAELTVLKHQRKEMKRRDSIIEESNLSQPGTLKKFQFFQRSESFSTDTPNTSNYKKFSQSLDSRRTSLVDNQAPVLDRKIPKLKLSGRSFSEVKSGFASGGKTPPISDGHPMESNNSRRLSMDCEGLDSPRRYSRLVHRH